MPDSNSFTRSQPWVNGTRDHTCKAHREESMRIRVSLVVVGVLAILAGNATRAQITGNRVVAPIVKKGLVVQIKDVVRLPETRGLRPADQDVVPAGWARVSYVRDLPDGRRYSVWLQSCRDNGRCGLYCDSDSALCTTRYKERIARMRGRG